MHAHYGPPNLSKQLYIIDDIESIQKRVMKIINFKPLHPYEEVIKDPYLETHE